MHLIVGLLVSFVVVAVFARRYRGVRGCRWRRERSGDAAGQWFYRCAACGGTGYTDPETVPQVCVARAGKP